MKKSSYKTFEKYNIQENYKIPIISGTQQIIQQIKPNRESFSIMLNTIEKYNVSKVPILYITLPGDKVRGNYIEKQIKPLCSSGQRVCQSIDGVWGKDPKTGKIHPEYSTDMKSPSGKTITYAEFGCTMAHINAAKYMVKNKLPYALVIEDDANFKLMPDWPKTLEQIISELPKGWTTCQLYFGHDDTYSEKGIQSRIYAASGTVAYLLSAKGASIVSNIDIQTYNKHLVADYLMFTCPGSQAYIHYPRYIITGEMASTIHRDHEDTHKQTSQDIITEFQNNI